MHMAKLQVEVFKDEQLQSKLVSDRILLNKNGDFTGKLDRTELGLMYNYACVNGSIFTMYLTGDHSEKYLKAVVTKEVGVLLRFV